MKLVLQSHFDEPVLDITGKLSETNEWSTKFKKVAWIHSQNVPTKTFDVRLHRAQWRVGKVRINNRQLSKYYQEIENIR